MESIVNEIINSEYKGFMAITGGGSESISMLTKYGGASKFLLGAVVPYTQQMLYEYTNKQVNPIARHSGAVSIELASGLADRAFEDAVYLNGSVVTNVIGIASTAKLTYLGERFGRKHLAYIAFTKHDEHKVYELKFTINRSSREQQEEILSRNIINCLLYGVGKSKTTGLKKVKGN